MADSTLAAAFKLPPAEAVDYLRQRGDLSVSYNWQDVFQEEHAYQFTVSRLANLDLLQAIHDGIVKSVNGDLTRRDWMKNTQALLEDAGWWGQKEVVDPETGKTVTTTFDPARLKLIYNTNVRTANSAGRWQRIVRNKNKMPYVRYITMRDERVRLSHRAWDNLVLPVDDPFWDTHVPPNGWNCRCRIMSISQAEYDKGESPLGEAFKKEAPPAITTEWTNKRTGEVMQIPAGIDPGFAYNPGNYQARMDNIAQVEAAKLDQVAPALADQYNAQSKQANQVRSYVEAAQADRQAKQSVLVLSEVPQAFSSQADNLDGVSTSGKKLALDHDSVLHIMDEHGTDSELARGQIPIDPYDFVLISDALNSPSSISSGAPATRRGAYMVEAVLDAAGWRYTVLFQVRRDYLVPYTMWKILKK